MYSYCMDHLVSTCSIDIYSPTGTSCIIYTVTCPKLHMHTLMSNVEVRHVLRSSASFKFNTHTSLRNVDVEKMETIQMNLAQELAFTQ